MNARHFAILLAAAAAFLPSAPAHAQSFYTGLIGPAAPLPGDPAGTAGGAEGFWSVRVALDPLNKLQWHVDVLADQATAPNGDALELNLAFFTSDGVTPLLLSAGAGGVVGTGAGAWSSNRPPPGVGIQYLPGPGDPLRADRSNRFIGTVDFSTFGGSGNSRFLNVSLVDGIGSGGPPQAVFFKEWEGTLARQVPEPAALVLLLSGLPALACTARRRRCRAAKP